MVDLTVLLKEISMVYMLADLTVPIMVASMVAMLVLRKAAQLDWSRAVMLVVLMA